MLFSYRRPVLFRLAPSNTNQQMSKGLKRSSSSLLAPFLNSPEREPVRKLGLREKLKGLKAAAAAAKSLESAKTLSSVAFTGNGGDASAAPTDAHHDALMSAIRAHGLRRATHVPCLGEESPRAAIKRQRRGAPPEEATQQKATEVASTTDPTFSCMGSESHVSSPQQLASGLDGPAGPSWSSSPADKESSAEISAAADQVQMEDGAAVEATVAAVDVDDAGDVEYASCGEDEAACESGWRPVSDGLGRVYWANDETGESSWEIPLEMLRDVHRCGDGAGVKESREAEASRDAAVVEPADALVAALAAAKEERAEAVKELEARLATLSREQAELSAKCERMACEATEREQKLQVSTDGAHAACSLASCHTLPMHACLWA